MDDVVARPRGPYSLALTARHAGDATRRFRDGIFDALLQVGDGVERGAARQHPDGSLRLVADSEEALERLRFSLALDDDHSEFLRRFRDDPLLGPATRRIAGLRPLRLATVEHALLRALCGQLIESRRARAIERRIIRTAMPARDGLHAPPTVAALRTLSPAELRRLGLHARRGATLVRLCRSLDLDRLRDADDRPEMREDLLRGRDVLLRRVRPGAESRDPLVDGRRRVRHRPHDRHLRAEAALDERRRDRRRDRQHRLVLLDRAAHAVEELFEVLRLHGQDDDARPRDRRGVRERRLDAVPVLQLRRALGAAGRRHQVGRAGGAKAGEQGLADLPAAENGDAVVHRGGLYAARRSAGLTGSSPRAQAESR